jgi:hypothetical protein
MSSEDGIPGQGTTLSTIFNLYALATIVHLFGFGVVSGTEKVSSQRHYLLTPPATYPDLPCSSYLVHSEIPAS